MAHNMFCNEVVHLNTYSRRCEVGGVVGRVCIGELTWVWMRGLCAGRGVMVSCGWSGSDRWHLGAV